MKERTLVTTELDVSDPVPGENRIDVNWKIDRVEIPENAVIVDRELLDYLIERFPASECPPCPLAQPGEHCPFMRFSKFEDFAAEGKIEEKLRKEISRRIKCRDFFARELQRRAGR